VTRRKWRIKRTMAVPANWQGTPDHFYHFLLGYFMPVILWQERTGSTEVAVRDCGPMNPWFELTRPGTDVEFMPPGIMLERLLSNRQERVILRDWDNPTRFHRRSLASFSRAILDRVSAPAHVRGDAPRITVLDRRPSADYFRSDAADSHGSGADRRSISNVAEIAAELGALGNVTVLDTAALSPAQQVRALAATDLLVAQHGAGLSNMVWLPAGGAVLEIKPPLPATITDIFSNLASARSLDYDVINQQHEHAEVAAAVVVSAATRLLTDSGAHIPTMTGSLPIRALRQLPRRW
jgi:hypothetical protein